MQVFISPDIRIRFEQFLVSKGIGDLAAVSTIVQEFIDAQSIPFSREIFFHLASGLCENASTKDLLARYQPEELVGWWESFAVKANTLDEYTNLLIDFMMEHPMIPNGLKKEDGAVRKVFAEVLARGRNVPFRNRNPPPKPKVLDDAWGAPSTPDPPMWSTILDRQALELPGLIAPLVPGGEIAARSGLGSDPRPLLGSDPRPLLGSDMWSDPLTASVKDQSDQDSDEQSDHDSEDQESESTPGASETPADDSDSKDADADKKRIKFSSLVRKIRSELEIETSHEDLMGLIDLKKLSTLTMKDAVKETIKIIGKSEKIDHATLSKYYNRLHAKLFKKQN